MSTQASRFNLTDDELTRAAQELATAVREYLEATKTGKGRRTASGFVDVVRGSLGRQRCSRGLFALVVQRAVELGLVTDEQFDEWVRPEGMVGRRAE